MEQLEGLAPCHWVHTGPKEGRTLRGCDMGLLGAAGMPAQHWAVFGSPAGNELSQRKC